MPDGNFNGLPIPYVIADNPDSKADSSVTINGLDLTEDRVLKSAQFSEAMTGEKMLANIKYTNGNFTDGIKFDGKLLDAVSIGGYKRTLSSTDDLDVLYTRADSGLYYCGNSVQNCPANFCMLAMVATGSDSNSVVIQAVFSASYIYVRVRSGSGTSFSWGAWRRYTNTVYEDVTITTGSTLFNTMYYGDATPTNATRNACVSTMIYDVTNSRPVYATWTANTTLRIYSPVAGTTAVVRVWYRT